MTQVATSDELIQRKCAACEGGVLPCSLDLAREQIAHLGNWQLDEAGKSIRRSLRFRNFAQALLALNRIAEIAEQEQHHPDLHLTGYRVLTIDLTTHAVGGLSENDFILAAKIDRLISDAFSDAKPHS